VAGGGCRLNVAVHRFPAVPSATAGGLALTTVVFAGMALAGVALAPAATQAQAVEARRTLRVGGLERSYLLYRPAGTLPRAGVPLVLVFHGGGGTARGIARHTGLTRVAEREGFAVVYPQGVRRRWNDGRGIHAAYDDVGFVRALLDTLRRALPVDPRRIYATGISNGAVFAHRLACDLPDTFAAIAPVAGGFPARMEPGCTGAAPVAVMAFQGTADHLMPYGGTAVTTRRGAVLSAERSVAFWARVSGCAAAPADSLLPERHAGDGTRVRRSTYAGCRRERPVQLYQIEGGGHTWPGGPAAAASVGRVSREVDATAAIVRFFSEIR
jgi:polyhydroxybutyrate depolymerase